MKPIKNPRELAVLALESVFQKEQLVPEALSSLPFDLSPLDRNLAHEIIYGTFRYWPGICRLMAECCRKPQKLPDRIRYLLATGMYQLLFMRSPSYAVVNESVSLVRTFRLMGLKNLVNGVLRNVSRRAGALQAEVDSSWFFPEWMASLASRHFSDLDALVAQWSRRPDVTYWTCGEPLHPNDEASTTLPHSYKLNGERGDLTETACYVQNESSQALAEAMCSLSPVSVLDVCAAPGGKAFYLAQFGQPDTLVACDPSEARMALLRASMERLGLSFETVVTEAEHADFGERRFDLVLVDAPCSALGIVGRHPEIKALRAGPARPEIVARQRRILDAAWRWVAPGGHLLYAVCSFDPSEVPQPPADALDAREAFDKLVPSGIPLHWDDHGFSIVPSHRFDGFSGCFLRKPEGSSGS